MDEMAKSYKGKYDVVGEIGGAGGGGDPFEAHIPLFKDILLKHKDANVFILGTDLLAKPAVAALKELNLFKPAGQAGAPIIVGVDGNPETLDAIRNGDVTACFSQYPYLQGVWTGFMADRWIHGRSDLIPTTLYFGGDVVTYSNVGNFKHLWGDIKWKQID
jgi:ABC-type sugar transport system substrate-binding protein